MNSTKSWKKPTPEQVNKALALLVHPQQRQYFFNRLENPEWIAELRKQKWFKHAPSAIQTDNNTVSFPNWAESRYLTRMAVYRPEEVLAIALAIETDNPSVHQDFVEAALKMPPAIAAKMEATVKGWLEEAPYSFYPLLGEKVGELISFLAQGGEAKVALRLARTLLAVQAVPQNNGIASTDYPFTPEPRPRFDEWHYNNILEKNVPDLVATTGEKTLILLCGLLQDTLAISRTLQRQSDDLMWEDYSYIWCPSVTDDSQITQSSGLKDHLIVAIRKAAQKILESDCTKVSTVIALLRRWHWRIFHRLAIALVREHSTVEPLLVAEILTNREYFDSPTFHQDYEYILLAQEQFTNLSDVEQQTILGWIINPSLNRPEEVNPDEHIRWIRHWQLRKLTPLKDHLLGEWQQTYEGLTREIGEMNLSDLRSSGIQVRSSVESPKTVQELAAMEIEQLVEFLKNWQPKRNNASGIEELFDSPSQGGLAWTLQRMVESNPLHYAAIADQFKGIPARYLTCLLHSLRNSFQQRPTTDSTLFPWKPVLSLCLEIVQVSEITRTPETASQVLRSEWREARRTIADILGLGLSAQNSLMLPFELREQVWAVLQPLTTDLDPTPEYEAQYYTSSDVEASNLSINTVRGEALHSVIRYALWLQGREENAEEETPATLAGFDKMPEVRQTLDTHLNPAADPSLAIRSTYGRWFPWLLLLDENWTQQHFLDIFPHDERLGAFRQAAWNSYIVFCSPYNNSLRLLFGEYRFAIEQLDTASNSRSYDGNPRYALVRHLMTFYWQGHLGLEEEGLLAQFYAKAPSTIRKQAIEFIGRSLWNTTGEVDSEIQARLVTLWSLRLSAVQNGTQVEGSLSELTPYGWWFASGKFEADWAIAQLKVVITTAGEIEADHLVVKQLVKLSETRLQSTLECLHLLVIKDTSDWRVYGWNDEARQILTLALQTNTPDLQEKAREVIDLLGRQGHWEFRDLLSLQRSSL